MVTPEPINNVFARAVTSAISFSSCSHIYSHRLLYGLAQHMAGNGQIGKQRSYKITEGYRRSMLCLYGSDRRPTYACAHDCVPSRDRATEYTPKSVAPPRHWGRVLLMFAFCAMDTNHSQDSFSAPATGLNFPGKTPNKVELKRLLESFQDTMD
eukprot:6214258-Pleurochrysis_carterae.AAC.3